MVPVAVEFDGEHFWVGGPGAVAQTRKFRNVAAGSTRVSIVFDDLLSMDPFVARGIRIYGEAEQPFEKCVGMGGPRDVYAHCSHDVLELEPGRGTRGRRVPSVARREHTT